MQRELSWFSMHANASQSSNNDEIAIDSADF